MKPYRLLESKSDAVSSDLLHPMERKKVGKKVKKNERKKERLKKRKTDRRNERKKCEKRDR